MTKHKKCPSAGMRTEDDDDDWKMTYVKVKDEFPGENGFWCVLRMARSPSPSNFSQ